MFFFKQSFIKEKKNRTHIDDFCSFYFTQNDDTWCHQNGQGASFDDTILSIHQLTNCYYRMKISLVCL